MSILLKVTDGPNGNDAEGFIDANKTDDYSYDANGNMIVDNNKGITDITYNHLNLPTKIVFSTAPTGNIMYIYNAVGQKVQKIVTETPANTVTTTDYFAGFQYKNAELQFFPTAEGYVKNTAGVLSYVYNYTDHLGNVRVSYEKDTTIGSLKILEENNYYPFGLKHSPSAVVNAQPDYKYKYNGKELQDELGLNVYDLEARNYMPDIGRWGNIDELAENFHEYSPYNFSNNNPVFFSDPTGLAPDGPNYLASTVVNKNGVVIDYKDDGDNNIYLDKRGGEVVGRERKGVKYEVGKRIIQDDLTNNNILFKDGIHNLNEFPSVKVEPTYATFWAVECLELGEVKLLEYIVYWAKGAKGIKYVGITSQFAIRQATHLRKKGIKIEKLLEGLSKSDAKAVEQVLIEMYKLGGKPGQTGKLLNKINSIAKTNPVYYESLKRGAELLKSVL